MTSVGGQAARLADRKLKNYSLNLELILKKTYNIIS